MIINNSSRNQIVVPVSDDNSQPANKEKVSKGKPQALSPADIADIKKKDPTFADKLFVLLSAPVTDANAAKIVKEVKRISEKNSSVVDIALVKKLTDELARQAGNKLDTVTRKGHQDHENTNVKSKTDHSKEVNPPPSPSNQGAFFSNIMGDNNLIDALVKLISVLNRLNALSNKQAAQMSQVVMDSARQAGNEGIAAAKQTRDGAITAGAINIGMQTAAAGGAIKSLHNESKSLDRNLRKSNDLEFEINSHSNAVHQSSQPLSHEGRRLNPEVETAMTDSQHKMQHKSTELKHKHRDVENKTAKTRLVADVLNQIGRTSDSITQGSFGVDAAGKNAQSELSRANQQVAGSTGEIDREVAKKALDQAATILQKIDAILENRNNTVAGIASNAV